MLRCCTYTSFEMARGVIFIYTNWNSWEFAMFMRVFWKIKAATSIEITSFYKSLWRQVPTQASTCLRPWVECLIVQFHEALTRFNVFKYPLLQLNQWRIDRTFFGFYSARLSFLWPRWNLPTFESPTCIFRLTRWLFLGVSKGKWF